MHTKIIYSTIFTIWYLLMANTIFAYSHKDSLKGGNGNGRNWWDVKYYNLNTDIIPDTKSIIGDNEIIFTITGSPDDSLQLDLQEPMILDSVYIEAFVNYSDAEFNLKLSKLKIARE